MAGGIILSNRLRAMQEAAANFGDSIGGIKESQRLIARQGTQDKMALESHGANMRQAANQEALQGFNLRQAGQQEQDASALRSDRNELAAVDSGLQSFGPRLPADETPTPFADENRNLRARLMASIETKVTGKPVSRDEYLARKDQERIKAEDDAYARTAGREKDAADLESTKAGTKQKGAEAEKTGMETKKLKAEIDALAKGGIDPEKAYSIEEKISSKFIAQNSGFAEMGDGIGRVRTAAKNPDGPGDMALIYGYMKILDPKTGIKEGEVASAQNAGSIPQSVIAAYNKSVNGQALNPTVRKQFVDRAEMLYSEADRAYQQSRTSFQKLASSYGVNPDRSTPDISRANLGGSSSGTKSFKSAREAMAAGLPAGTRVMINGEDVEID